MGVGDEAVRAAAARGREISDAVQALLKQLETNDDAERLLAAGKIHEIEQVYAKARSCYETLLAIDPKRQEARARLAVVLLKSGQRLRGLEVARGVAAEAPDLCIADLTGRPRSVQTVLGDASRDNGDTTGAKAAYGRAIELAPGDSYSAAQLAQMLLSEDAVEPATDLADRYLRDEALTAFRATKSLLANDPHRLPALAGLVVDHGRSMADHT